jgi:hypothetical protein
VTSAVDGACLFPACVQGDRPPYCGDCENRPTRDGTGLGCQRQHESPVAAPLNDPCPRADWIRKDGWVHVAYRFPDMKQVWRWYPQWVVKPRG